MTRELIIQLRDALETARERYGAIDPDFHPGEDETGDEDPIHEEAEEIDVAIKAAAAFLSKHGDMMTEIGGKISRPLFRINQWPLRTLVHDVPGRVTIVDEPKYVEPCEQLDLAAAVLRGWPIAVVLRRLAGGAYRPLDQRSARVLGAIMGLKDPNRCAVYLVQDSTGSSLTLDSNGLSISTILDHKGRWEVQRALETAGRKGQANRLEHMANAWSDFPLTIHEVLDEPAADEIAEWLDRAST